MNKLDKNKTVIVSLSEGLISIDYVPEDIEILIVNYDAMEECDTAFCPNCNEDINWHKIEDGVCPHCGFDTQEIENNWKE